MFYMEGRKNTRLDRGSSIRSQLVRVLKLGEENIEIFKSNIVITRVVNNVKGRHERDIDDVQVRRG